MARPRKPTRLKIVAGTMKAERINHNEPDVHEPRIPEAPDDLTDLEKKLWAQYAEVLEPMKVTTAADFTMFQSLVATTAQMLELEAIIRARPLRERYAYDTASSNGGYLRRPLPEANLLRSVKAEMSHLATKFGLSPADRSRVNMDRSGEKNGKTKEAEFGV